MTEIRNFGQLKSTRDGDARSIKTLIATAKTVGIRVDDIETNTAYVLNAIDSRFGKFFAIGGEHEVSDEDVSFIFDNYVQLAQFNQALEQTLNHYRHYQEARGQHNYHVDQMNSRPKQVKLADGVESNKLLEGYIQHAADSKELLESSLSKFDEALEAIKNRDLVSYNKLIVGARQFGTREHFLNTLLRRGTLLAA